jgi:hypothetical protein
MNLDAFWSRAKSLMLGNQDKVAFGLKLSTLVGRKELYKTGGLLPDFNYCGYEVAVEMLLHSCRPRKYSKKYTQFDTVRKLRSGFSNHCQASESPWCWETSRGSISTSWLTLAPLSGSIDL